MDSFFLLVFCCVHKAPCHYDGYHNVYVQIRGKKTFRIAPPESHMFLKPYPFVHPSHAQCQVRLLSTRTKGSDQGSSDQGSSDQGSSDQGSSDKGSSDQGSEMKVQTATLIPGDVLYLPPLWYHEVVAEEMSISVNGWTPSKESDVVERMFAVPLPMSWSSKEESMDERDDDLDGGGVTSGVSNQKLFLLSRMMLLLLASENEEENEKEEEEEEEEEKKVRVSAGGGAWNLDGVEQELSALYTERFHDLVHQKILPGLFLELDEMSKKKCQQLSTGLGRMDGRKKKEEEDLMRWSKVTRNLVRMLSPRTRKTWVGNFIESLILTRVGREHVDQVSVVLLLVTHCVHIMLNDDVRTTPVTTALEL